MRIGSTILFIIVLFIFIACGTSANDKSKPVNHFTIDSLIQKEAKENISFKNRESAFEDGNTFITHYKSKTYRNDTLYSDIDTLRNVQSSYYWSGDSLIVSMGLAHSYSSLLIISSNKKIKFFLEACTHENYPKFKLNLSDTATDCLLVPLKDYELILSEIPDISSKQAIYGYVKYGTATYYYDYNGEYNSQNWNDDHYSSRHETDFYFKSIHTNK